MKNSHFIFVFERTETKFNDIYAIFYLTLHRISTKR